VTRAGSHKSEEEWNVALERAASMYPNIQAINWTLAFNNDLDMMGRMIGDILKLQKAEENPHRRGRRTVPQVSVDKLYEMFDGFSNEPLPVALAKLVGKRSVRQVASKCNMSHMTFYRFLKGQAEPNLLMIEQIAAAFNKPPHYFAEYRAGLLSELLKQKLLQEPNLSVTMIRQAMQNFDG
jgi:transcriptional regulator with XRE-family HTH domain